MRIGLRHRYALIIALSAVAVASTVQVANYRESLRLAAEREWLDYWHDEGLPVHVLRLAGIYGPGRGPFAKVRDGSKVT